MATNFSVQYPQSAISGLLPSFYKDWLIGHGGYDAPLDSAWSQSMGQVPFVRNPNNQAWGSALPNSTPVTAPNQTVQVPQQVNSNASYSSGVGVTAAPAASPAGISPTTQSNDYESLIARLLVGSNNQYSGVQAPGQISLADNYASLFR